MTRETIMIKGRSLADHVRYAVNEVSTRELVHVLCDYLVKLRVRVLAIPAWSAENHLTIPGTGVGDGPDETIASIEASVESRVIRGTRMTRTVASLVTEIERLNSTPVFLTREETDKPISSAPAVVASDSGAPGIFGMLVERTDAVRDHGHVAGGYLYRSTPRITRREYPTCFPETFDPTAGVERGEVILVEDTDAERVGDKAYLRAYMNMVRVEHPGVTWSAHDVNHPDAGPTRALYGVVGQRVVAVLLPMIEVSPPMVRST